MTQIAIPQNSRVVLYKTMIADDRELVFSNITAQQNYYNKHYFRTFENVSVVKKSLNKIKLEIPMGDVLQCNMLSFINPSFDNKTFYAKIIDYEYISNNTTAIFYEIDYWQTFMFDVEYYDSMIEREHLSEALYQKALANPQDDSIIELATEEDISIPEEAYTFTNDGDSEWGAPSKIAPAKGLEQVFLLQIAPFMDTEEKDASGYTRSDYLKKLQAEWDKFVKEHPNELAPYYTGEIDATTDKPAKTWLGNIYINDFLNSEGGRAIDKAWQERKAKVLSEFKTSTTETKSEWKEFLKAFPEIIEPGLTQNGVLSTYCLIQPFTIAGQGKIQEAIDFLTLKGASSSVVGYYIVPKYMVDDIQWGGGGYVVDVTNPSNSRHPKLNTGKFSYIEAQAPNGVKKQYHYRNFLDNHNQKFMVLSNINGQPVTVLTPVNYLQENKGNGITIENSLSFSEFVAPAYMTDQYLTFLSSQMQSSLMEKSAINSNRYLRNNIMQIASSTIGGAQAGAGAGGIASGIGAATGLISSGFNAYMNSIDRNTLLADADRISAVNSGASASAYKKGLTPSLAWKGSEGAFNNDTYNAGSSSGWLAYMFSGIRFRLDFKYINDYYKERYEKYFDHYGYKSNRFGAPRVGLWATGSSDQEPHWEQINGVPTTYVKTDGCRVLGPILVATREIQDMFDRGIRFIKGDGL